MRELFFRSLRPPGQLWFLLLICSVSLLLFIEFGSSLVSALYGFDLVENPNQLQQYDQPYVIDANKILLLIQHIGLFILPALVFNQIFSYGRGKSFLFWGENPRLNKVLIAVLIMLVSLPVINFLLALNTEIMAGLSGTLAKEIKAMEDQASGFTSRLIANTNFGGFIGNLLLMAVLPAIGEEFFFRGILQKITARWTGRAHLSVWIVAAIFSAIHFQFFGFLPRLLLGAMFGYMTLWMGSLWYAVVAHFINNAATLLSAYLIQKKIISAEVDGVSSLWDYLPVFAISLVILGFLMWWIRRNSVFAQYQLAYMNHPHLVLRVKKEDDEQVSEEENESGDDDQN